MAMSNSQCEQFSLVLSQLMEKQRQEEDQLLQVFNHHLIDAFHESGGRHTSALYTSLENAADLIKQKDEQLASASLKSQMLHQNLQKVIEARDAWQILAMEKLEMATDLKLTLDSMATPAPCFSSTSDQPEKFEVGESSCIVKPFLPCKLCSSLRACMVVLPCRHLSICKLCHFSATTCPICGTEKAECIEVFHGDE